MHLLDGALTGDISAGELDQAGAFAPFSALSSIYKPKKKRRVKGRRRLRRAARKLRKLKRKGRAAAPQIIVVHSRGREDEGDDGDEGSEDDDDGAEGVYGYEDSGMIHVGSLPATYSWKKPEPGQWEPRGIGDFRTSQVYSRSGNSRLYGGEAIPTMIGSMDDSGMVYAGELDGSAGLPARAVWGKQDNPAWEPRSVGNFRSSQVYGSGRRGAYQGEADPTMVGDLDGMLHVGDMDESGMAFMLGAARRRSAAMRAQAAEVDDLEEEASEGMMLISGPSIGFIR